MSIFQDILTPLAQRGTSSSVYFYRIIGCNDEQSYLAEVADLDENLSGLNQYTLFDKTIPVTTDLSMITGVRSLIEQVALKYFSNGTLANILQTHGYFSLTSDPQSNLTIRDAFQIMLNLYLKNQPSVNLNIATNFVIKILCWFIEYGKMLGKKSAYNPKLVYWGSPKVHEIYFLILMSLSGCDVLVLNPSFKDKFDTVDLQNEYCFLIKYTRELAITPFPHKNKEKDLSQTEPYQMPNDPAGMQPSPKAVTMTDLTGIHSEGLVSDCILVAKLAKSADIFTDILVPLDKRSGFVGEPYPILPVYFTRYIGVPDHSDDREVEYYNRLYNLDQALQATGSYLKFIEGISAPDATESALIPQRLHDLPYKDRLEMLLQIVSAKLLPQTHIELLDNTITKVFVDTVNLFAEKNTHANISVLLNFSFKMIIWFNRYFPQLFRISSKRDQSKKGLDYNHNPKILFYGDIKTHEIYLLNAFHKMGSDILFVHSEQEGDKPFQRLDEKNSLGTLILNEYNLRVGPFPETERLVRKSTVAYNASKEIEEVIYGEDVGLFKPWQFESYLTEPVTLKTTFDELKILWREPAKTRPEFKVQNQKVYVPNLFAKINGVSENQDDYWQDLKTLTMVPNTKLIKAVPFTNTIYTKQELFQAIYLLNDQGLFDEAKVMESSHYKFGYLKAPLQLFLLTKINELILSGMLLETADEKFKLKILMTILTMDESILRLIEVFDYPQEVPKVIVYDNNRNSFSEEDAITIAYLNLIGLDIVIFTPTNYAAIERYIKSAFFDVHQLPLVKFELPIPPLNKIATPSINRQGLISRIFNFRSKNNY